MINIIGLGSAGCNIAEKFEKNNIFNVKLIDVDIEGENCINIPYRDSSEDYEKYCPNFSSSFKDIKENVTLIIGGSGNISGMSLALLHQLKDKCNIKVIYVRPDLESIFDDQRKKQEKVTFNVLQEYARSGAFTDILLLSNSEMEKALHNISMMNYYDCLNELIFSSFISIFNLSIMKPIINSFSKTPDFCRIFTFGIYNLEKDEEHLYYPLEYIDHKIFYFGINKSQLENDTDLYKNLKQKIKNKINDVTKVSFKIFPIDEQENFCYIVAQTRKIQV